MLAEDTGYTEPVPFAPKKVTDFLDVLVGRELDMLIDEGQRSVCETSSRLLNSGQLSWASVASDPGAEIADKEQEDAWPSRTYSRFWGFMLALLRGTQRKLRTGGSKERRSGRGKVLYVASRILPPP